MDWRYGSSSRAPALQGGNPEFKWPECIYFKLLISKQQRESLKSPVLTSVLSETGGNTVGNNKTASENTM
jgi:hypothetical protein